jgi:hypothetical protein
MAKFMLMMVLVMASWLIAPLSARADGAMLSLPGLRSAGFTLAASSVPSAEVTNFARAYQSIQGIREEAEADMVKAVESEGLTVERFNAIADSQTAEAADSSSLATQTEERQFAAAIEDIITIRQTAETVMESAIEDTGLSVERFNQILEQSTQDKSLSQRIGDQIKALP